MNVAFLFNSDHEDYESYCGLPVMVSILNTGVLQAITRNMRVSLGDILTFGLAARSNTPTFPYLKELCTSVYQPRELDRLIRDRLEATHGTATVYCWLFQNMTSQIAESMHTRLSKHNPYLGAMDVHFDDPLSLRLFRNSLIEEYRFCGKDCSVFFGMGENEAPDCVIEDTLIKHGFAVIYEDKGARRTIFDNYDTLEHFKRISDFRHIFSQIFCIKDDELSDLVHSLEELHPRLFQGFASAARTLDRAETQEDLAQVALSGRRLLEQTADYLFPAQSENWNNRTVSASQYKNRLWAYIEKTLSEVSPNDISSLDTLGKEADRLVDLFNSSLHANPIKNETTKAFYDLVVWLKRVIDISPAHMRQPYMAYMEQLIEFLHKEDENFDDELKN